MNLANQVVLVTGASRGIGRAIATELGKQGATVVGTATPRRAVRKPSPITWPPKAWRARAWC